MAKQQDFAEKVKKAGQLAEKIKVEATIISIGGESDVEKGIQKAIDQKDSVGGIVMNFTWKLDVVILMLLVFMKNWTLFI